MALISRRSAVVAAVLLLAGNAWAAESVYTPTKGKTCKKLPENHLGGSRCQGPDGMSFLILDDGNVLGVLFGPPGREAVVSGMHWRAVGKLIGDQIEWRMSDGKPYAAIVRAFTVDENEKPVQRLLVAKVSPASSCQIAAVDAHQKDANERARKIADEQAPKHECVAPK